MVENIFYDLLKKRIQENPTIISKKEGETMYKVKCLKNYGVWAKKGAIVEINNDIAKIMERNGVVEILEFKANQTRKNESLTAIAAKLEIDMQIIPRGQGKHFPVIYNALKKAYNRGREDANKK